MNRQDITGVVLAGGRATRWDGRDKGLIEVWGRPMISHVLDALAPQVEQVIINANRNLDQYRAFGLAVVTDATGEKSFKSMAASSHSEPSGRRVAARKLIRKRAG